MSAKQWGHGYNKGQLDTIKLFKKIQGLSADEYETILNKVSPGTRVEEFYFIPVKDKKDAKIVIVNLHSQKWVSLKIPYTDAVELAKNAYYLADLRSSEIWI